ncbi:MAG: succinate dehydrogenase/fumarate reductase iron-sulfur subunit [Aquificaceae bacterium]|nr:succinate dehydrogenase/fumarate reductase iron-sulfur subunit [Aquificaceae bacterium]MDW8236907.1 succinate dehydrogenase/fumarate reductase iron-sulfur subunit [Aquificaceae bacterium]
MLLKVRIKRQKPGQEPAFESYEVPVSEGMTLLDALNFVRDEIDPTLSVRQFCKAGICGTCAVNVNGFPKLVCKEQATPYALLKTEVVFEPINLPTIKDLVVDPSQQIEKLKSMSLWLKELEQNLPIPPEKSKEVEESADCILCFACQSYCPQTLDKSYIGPLFFAKLFRFAIDPREEHQEHRLNQSLLGGLYSCLSCNKCNNACPKEVRPATLIRNLMQFN